MYKKLLEKIKEYKNICIYRHVRPDGDACFSQFALYEFIKDNFKDKKVKMCGTMEYDLLPYAHTESSSFIKKSLVIVVDTASHDRVDDLSYVDGDYIIKIDHHPANDQYADLNIVDDKAASTTQLLTKILFSNSFKNMIISEKVCMYLYCGLLTDSNCYTTSNTTYETLLYGSKLVEKGNLDVGALNNYLYSKDLNDYKNITKFRNLLTIKDGVGYVLVNKDDLKSLKMDQSDAKNAIDEFNHIKGLKIWAVFAYNAKTGLYDASIRSNKRYVINTTCIKYHGGGHKNACGAKNLSLKECKAFIKDLIKIAKES